MDLLAVVFVALLLALVIMPFVALAKAARAERLVNELRSLVERLEQEIRSLRHPAPMQPARPEQSPAPAPVPKSPPLPTLPKVQLPPPAAPPPKPAQPQQSPWTTGPVAPPPPAPVEKQAPTEAQAPRPPVDWEEFMGAKLFAWIGGLALFLGIAFFVKYSFDHNLIPPELRVAIGFAAGLALLAGGMLMKRKENVVTAQTLCATGIVVLYAVTFACRSYYHFPFFGLGTTFFIMSLVTVAAFLLAVRMNGLVIAILGIAGGFLTPVLLNTGQDYALGLFGYIALLDAGLLAIAHRRHWKSLPALGAIGTVLTQFSWLATFFVPEQYFARDKVLIAMAVFTGFQGLFLAAASHSRRTGKYAHSPGEAALVVGAAAMLGAFYFLSFPALAVRPVLLCGYLFLTDLGLVALSLIVNKIAGIRWAAGIAAFLFLAIWTENYLTNAFLVTALGCYFVFALFHTALPLALQRIQKTAPSTWSQLFPVFSLLLILMPIFQLHDLSILIWPFVLFIDLLAFFVAVVTMSLAPVLVVLVLTLVALAGCLLQIPATLTGLPSDLFLIGAFATFFVIASAWANRRLSLTGNQTGLAAQLPAVSSILPFLLLVLVILRLPLHDASPLFGLALLLVLLLLGLAKFLSLDALPIVGLISVLAVEHAWLLSPFHLERPLAWLGWYLLFYAVFTIFPFLFRGQFAERKLPWMASALAGPLNFQLLYETVKITFPRMPHGLPPALLAIPPLLGLALIARKHAPANPARLTQLALYGGVALFFITLIFPLQLDREWITISWALEGAALCWLFHRVPHRGLRLVGVGLLVVAFVRLGLNPLVLTYHVRAAQPVFNWYLYAFGVVSVGIYAGARLLAPPRNVTAGFNVPPLLYSLGTILLFLLVNIEIADYFSAPGSPVLTFEFSGNFARDMSYSIAWALFALLLLVIGIAQRNAAVRYSSLGLLGVTVLKLFLHDLSELDQLYRIGAFIAVAIIAILASFLYQRFLAIPGHDPEPAPRH